MHGGKKGGEGMKRIVSLIIAVMVLSGCVPHKELDKLGIAEAVGVDYENGVYTLTVQYFNTDSSGGVTAIDSSAPNAVVASGKGKTIESALQAVSYTTGSSIMIGSAAVIVFGGDALFSLDDALRLASSHRVGNLRAYIAAAKGKAADIMNVKFSEGNASVEKLEEILRNAEDIGYCRCVNMFRAMEKLRCPTGSVVLPLLMAYPAESDASEDGSGIVIAGGAVCQTGRYADDLDPREMSGLALLDPSADGRGRCELVLTFLGNDTRVMLYNIVPRITPTMHDGKLHLKAEICADCKVISTSLDDPFKARNDIEALCAEETEKRVRAALEKTLNAHGADAVGLCYTIRSGSPDVWKAIEDAPPAYFEDAEIAVQADVKLESFGIAG